MSVTVLLPKWVAPIHPHPVVHTHYAVAIDSDDAHATGTILSVGPAQSVLAQFPNAQQVKLENHLLTPGFVNAHSHAAMSLLRGVGDDLPLQAWLEQRIWPIEGKLMSPEFVFDGTVLAAYEMLLGGVTCFNDMYFFPGSTARAAIALGMRAHLGLPVFEFPSPYGTGADDYLAKGLAIRDEFRNADGGSLLVSFNLAPHAPYTVSDASFVKIATLANELGLGIQTHLHETAFEIQQSLNQYGKRPINRLQELDVLGPDFLAIHAVHCNDDDIALLSKNGASVVHCPHSNMKLGSGLAPVAQFLRAGINLAIGTDGSASNNRLDLLSEAHAASLLAKGVTQDASVLSAHQTLHAMTLGGARACGLGQVVGSIEIGKQADLACFDLSAIELQPVHDPVAQLIYSGNRSHLSDVWISGRRVVKKRQLAGTDAQATLSEVVARCGLWHNKTSEMLNGSH